MRLIEPKIDNSTQAFISQNKKNGYFDYTLAILNEKSSKAY